MDNVDNSVDNLKNGRFYICKNKFGIRFATIVDYVDNRPEPISTKGPVVGKTVDKGGTLMLPVLFEFGPLSVYTWGLSLSLAILVGTIIAIRLARHVGIDSDTTLNLAIVLVIGGVVGARLFFVFVYEPAYFIENPLEIIALWKGGMVYYGAFIGGFITGTWYVLAKKLPFWKLADVVAPPLALGYGIVRLGCFANGCCFGRHTDSFLGVIFPFLEGAPNISDEFRYPTQLFSSALGFLLFVLLMFLWKKKKFDGQILLIFIILYSIGRSVVEYFRENLLVFGPVTVSQFVSALVIIPAVFFYWQRSRAGGTGVNGPGAK